MDDSVFLDACHPIDQSMSEDLTYPARHHTRTQSPPQYYYVDFSISRKYEASDNNTLEQPLLGKDRDSVPGFKGDFAKPWSPFATDVWCLGHAIQEIFLDVRCSTSLSHFTPHFYKTALFRREIPKRSGI